MGYQTEMMTQGHPYDILINGAVKVDVKSANISLIRGSRAYVVGINKKSQTCDIYMIYCLGEDGVTVEKELVIPSHHLSLTTLNIGMDSKYDYYEKSYKYIEEYVDFMTIVK